MVPKPIVANSSFVTYKYGKNKLGVEVRKSKNAKKRDIDSQPYSQVSIKQAGYIKRAWWNIFEK